MKMSVIQGKDWIGIFGFGEGKCGNVG